MGEETIKPKEIDVLDDNNLTKPITNVKNEVIKVDDYEVIEAKEPKKEEAISHFTKDEMVDKLSRLPPNEHGMLFQTLWRTGTRVSEVINVCKKDLDFDNQEIKIRWLKNRKYNTRVIPMHNSLRLLLYTFTAKINAEDRIFPYTRQYVDQLCKKYGFEHAHKIRHSFAVNFLRQSDSPTAFVNLQHLLGHNDIKTTMVYLKVVPMEQKKALEKINFD